MRNAIVLCFALLSGSLLRAADQPNIIFIVADDMGYGDPECYNPKSMVPTPHMNRLADEGMLFTDAHSPSSTCTPSRYSFLTGRYAWRTRLKSRVLWTTFDEPLIEHDRFTVADLAKAQGYTTACIGKWHLGMNFYQKGSDEFARGKRHHHKGLRGLRDVDFERPAAYSPNDLGFDYSFISGAGHNMEPHAFIRNREVVSIPTVWRENKTAVPAGGDAGQSHEGWMSPEWSDENVDVEFTKEAVAFIRRSHAEDSDRPFFLYLALVSPHKPWTPHERFQDQSKGGPREDFVMQFDASVGEVMNALEELGLTEHTLLMVSSDNGPTLGAKGHQTTGPFNGQKPGLLEGGHRVPFLVRWPAGVPQGVQNETPVNLVGLMATLADLLDVSLPDDAAEDSMGFLNALLGKRQPAPETIEMVHHDYRGDFAFRQGDWKLISAPKNERLFHLGDDPYEKNDLYAERPDVAARLSARLKEIQASKGHRLE